MKSYVFRVVVEPDDERWHASCPILEDRGAVTWGDTAEEALDNIRDVVQMVVSDLLDEGESIPSEPEGEVQVFSESRVAVNV